jgi:hypothetical protein
VFIFLHIYKTAGQTLAANLNMNFRPREKLRLYTGPLGLDQTKEQGSRANPGWVRESVDEYVAQNATSDTKILMGHLAYFGIHGLVEAGPKTRYILFLRHPIERVISLYYYLRNKSTNFWHHEIVKGGWDLEEWLEHSAALWAHDGQVRQLLIGAHDDVSTHRGLTREHLEEAKRRLRESWFCGLTESFRYDSLFLYGKLRCYNFAPEKVVNATPAKERVPLALRRRVAQRNALDLELYDYARELHSKRIRSTALNYSWNVLRALVRERKAQAKVSTAKAR